MRITLRHVTAITFLLLAGCQRTSPPAPSKGAVASSLPKISVKSGAKMIYTFVKEGSIFTTVDKIDKIPADRRGWVRVVDLSMKPTRRKDYELVYVADLRQPERDGTFPYVVMSRRAFEMAAVSRPRAGATAPAASPQSGGPGKREVVLYSSAWCSACRAARSFLQQEGIKFVEKDIEKDPDAAAELLQKAKAAGISASGVPVLDVGGTLVQGFDPERIRNLLGDKK